MKYGIVIPEPKRHPHPHPPLVILINCHAGMGTGMGMGMVVVLTICLSDIRRRNYQNHNRLCRSLLLAIFAPFSSSSFAVSIRIQYIHSCSTAIIEAATKTTYICEQHTSNRTYSQRPEAHCSKLIVVNQLQ